MTRPSLAPKRGLPNPPGLVVLVCRVPPAVRAVGQLRQLICRCPHVQPCNTVANVHSCSRASTPSSVAESLTYVKMAGATTAG